MKKLFRVILVLLLLLVAAFFIFRTPDTNREEMIAKYGSEASQFVNDGLGTNIHYRDEGNRSGIPIVLIHGSNGHLQTWDSMIDILSKKYRLISIDLPGHGLTGPHGKQTYSADAYLAAITKVLDTAGVDRAYWVGNSMGGWLTWRAGLAVPERVLGLVVIDGSGAPVNQDRELYLGARLAQSSAGQALIPHIMPKFMVRSSLEGNYADKSKISEELVERYWDLLRFPGSRQAIAHRANVDREPLKWNEIGNLAIPVLLLWGKQDKVTPLSYGKAFEAAITGSKLIVYPDAGHLPMEETPEQVARDIDQWIGDVAKQSEPANME